MDKILGAYTGNNHCYTVSWDAETRAITEFNGWAAVTIGYADNAEEAEAFYQSIEQSKPPVSKSLYEEMVEAGVEIDSHYSDLYVPVNDITSALVTRHYGGNHYAAQTFINNIDGKRWYNIPFAYAPYWAARGM